MKISNLIKLSNKELNNIKGGTNTNHCCCCSCGCVGTEATDTNFANKKDYVMNPPIKK